MYKFSLWLILVLLGLGCSDSHRESFHYLQNFSPDSGDIKSQSERLVFADVREETRLSSWQKANWQLTDSGVSAVGSRRDEWRRREQSVQDVYQGQESYVTLRGYRVPWLTLSMGDLDWLDYSVHTTMTPVESCSAGIAFRYLNSRQYYAFILTDAGKAMLVLRMMNKEATPEHEAWSFLKVVDFPVNLHETYRLQVTINGSNIECQVNDKSLISYSDSTLQHGKIALVADNPVSFGPVSVKGSKSNRSPDPKPFCANPHLVFSLPLPLTNIERNFFFLDPDTDGENEIIIAEKDKSGYSYRCIEFDGSELWVLDDIEYPTTEGGDHALQVFDINGDGMNEIVAAIDFQIKVLDGKTGELLYSAPTPRPNPYFDSRDYRYERLLGDALCKVYLGPDQPAGLYIKDRYTNIWMYDHDLNLLWHKALSTAHFPLPIDLDDDGYDEILANHELLSCDGKSIWSIPLSDHVDNIAYVSLDPGNRPRYLFLAGGEMGLLKVDPMSGQILTRHELGHIQSIVVADFLPENSGLELITQTLWREDEIHYLFDMNLNMLTTWQGSYGRMFAVPWGEKKRSLALIPDGIVDPLTGRMLCPSFGRVLTVMDDQRWGNGLVVVESDNHLEIYAPEMLQPPPKKRLYRDIQTNYLPEIALPGKEILAKKGIHDN